GARIWKRLASVLVDRLGARADRQRSWVLHGEAVDHMEAGDAKAALDLARRALAVKEKILRDDDPDIAVSLATEANALRVMGRPTEAFAVNEKAYDITVRAYGRESQPAAELLNNIGEDLIALDRPAEALRPLRDS